jgi:hypothetical protein
MTLEMHWSFGAFEEERWTFGEWHSCIGAMVVDWRHLVA